ncbi:hypothetical protein HAX54_043669 [Datura stramonium]|uniref:Uncharacterized protein n=1 Tax=Datura stramonium TaxID=4076 RepID=A0ABS8W2N7_DATST|nr:hypothetical protein [Datura stramonium]
MVSKSLLPLEVIFSPSQHQGSKRLSFSPCFTVSRWLSMPDILSDSGVWKQTPLLAPSSTGNKTPVNSSGKDHHMCCHVPLTAPTPATHRSHMPVCVPFSGDFFRKLFYVGGVAGYSNPIRAFIAFMHHQPPFQNPGD